MRHHMYYSSHSAQFLQADLSFNYCLHCSNIYHCNENKQSFGARGDFIAVVVYPLLMENFYVVEPHVKGLLMSCIHSYYIILSLLLSSGILLML